MSQPGKTDGHGMSTIGRVYRCATVFSPSIYLPHRWRTLLPDRLIVQADEDRISVGTVNGETIWLDDVMRQAERLPAKFRQAPMESYFNQLVTDMVDSKIAADAARAAKYDTKKEIASAMKTCADRVLAESWIGEKLVVTLPTQPLKKPIKLLLLIPPLVSRSLLLIFLLPPKMKLKQLLLRLQVEQILPNWRRVNQQGQVGQMAAH